MKGHIWENNKVHTGQKKPFAPKITASYPFITKRAGILWPIYFVGLKPEELDDTADGDNENDKSSHRGAFLMTFQSRHPHWFTDALILEMRKLSLFSQSPCVTCIDLSNPPTGLAGQDTVCGMATGGAKFTVSLKFTSRGNEESFGVPMLC